MFFLLTTLNQTATESPIEKKTWNSDEILPATGCCSTHWGCVIWFALSKLQSISIICWPDDGHTPLFCALFTCVQLVAQPPAQFRNVIEHVHVSRRHTSNAEGMMFWCAARGCCYSAPADVERLNTALLNSMRISFLFCLRDYQHMYTWFPAAMNSADVYRACLLFTSLSLFFYIL